MNKPTTFGEWMSDERTQALRRINQRANDRVHVADLGNANRQDKINALEQHILGLEERQQNTTECYEIDLKQIATLQDKIDALQSALRLANSLTDCYKRTAVRRFKQINELKNDAKVNGDFIQMQSTRLSNARRHLSRVRAAVAVYEVGDNGPSFDL